MKITTQPQLTPVRYQTAIDAIKTIFNIEIE